MQNKFTKFPSHPNFCPQCNLATKLDIPFCERCKFDLRHGTLNSQKYGECIFCFERSKLSKEHIFPSWLRNVYEPHFLKHIHTLTRPSSYETEALIHSEDNQIQNDVYHTVVRNVCESCNNGWMSDLQANAKLIVKRLADGHWDNFTDDEQYILTRWSIMLSINFQSFGRQLIAKPYQRADLRKGKIPPGWKLFLGSLKDVKNSGYNFTRPICIENVQEAEGTPSTIVSAFFA